MHGTSAGLSIEIGINNIAPLSKRKVIEKYIVTEHNIINKLPVMDELHKSHGVLFSFKFDNSFSTYVL